MGCCGRPDPVPVQPRLPPREMNFAFNMVETLTRHPAEFFTIMECLRLGGHKVVILTSQESVPANLGFDFSHFEIADVAKPEQDAYCQKNSFCMLFNDGYFKVMP